MCELSVGEPCPSQSVSERAVLSRRPHGQWRCFSGSKSSAPMMNAPSPPATTPAGASATRHPKPSWSLTHTATTTAAAQAGSAATAHTQLGRSRSGAPALVGPVAAMSVPDWPLCVRRHSPTNAHVARRRGRALSPESMVSVVPVIRRRAARSRWTCKGRTPREGGLDGERGPGPPLDPPFTIRCESSRYRDRPVTHATALASSGVCQAVVVRPRSAGQGHSITPAP